MTSLPPAAFVCLAMTLFSGSARLSILYAGRALGAVATARDDLADLLATAGGDIARAFLMAQRRESGAHHIIGVRGAERFGDHILDAERFEHGAHRAAGDDARAGRRGAQNDTTR